MTSGHAHDHQHHHRARADSTRALAITLGLVVGYMTLEVVGGLVSGSLALLADAGHMLSDAGALALTLFAMRFARRPATSQRTYGYHRAEILAALANGATLLAIAILIVVEAYERLWQPPHVRAGLMLAVAAGGLAVNALGLWTLRGSRDAGLNERGAWLHVLTDALGSVQAIAAAALIWTFGWRWVDPLASILIVALVVYSSWALIRQSVAVLMEGAPGHIDVDEVQQALLQMAGVTGVHDLHVWSITSGYVALSAHVICSAPARDDDDVLRRAREMLAQRFDIRHTTIQIERDDSCEQHDHRTH